MQMAMKIQVAPRIITIIYKYSIPHTNIENHFIVTKNILM